MFSLFSDDRMIWIAVILLVVLPLATTGQRCPAECTSCDNGIANCLGTGIRDIPRNFPNTITTMELSGNQLTELSSSSFQELTSLQTLRISGNGISEVMDRSFISLPSLMSIDLSNNPIVYIHDKAFEGLTHLRLLSITSTKIRRIGRSLNGLDSLHTVNMVSNQIEALEDENFEFSINLRMIDLSQNQITRISPKTFANLKLLRYLSLSSNPIVRVPELQFGSSILQMVDFTNCRLEDVPGKMPESVADFRLGNNKLTEIKAEHFENITNLRLITLNNNQITKVDDKAFGYLDRLMEIWLSNNRLKSIPRLLPRNIHKLFLDHNGIYEIAQRNFAINSQLEVLSLDTNRVERIAEGAWDEMPKLRSVNLNANNLQYVQHRREVEGRELTSLDNREFVKPREITQQDDSQELVVSVSRSDLAQPKKTQDNSSPDVKPKKLKKKNKKNRKNKNKNKKNKKRKIRKIEKERKSEIEVELKGDIKDVLLMLAGERFVHEDNEDVPLGQMEREFVKGRTRKERKIKFPPLLYL
ncbi:Hypothetical predicted protein [Mytilus galloprovincialis]|uniref:Uncharacterized protein n=1 Tax=Mytilus galloprovincialis TaxID=29158 RepID=A0A8B6DED6_MYTGA|nr:Hypothetical predicted protein [Mytilus galloprovincialis]